MAEAKVGDILTRLEFYTEGDALDFQKTGRAVFVVEDGVAELPLPAGPQGEQGEPGEPGGKLAPDLILQETTDGLALSKLQDRSATWRTGNIDMNGYFAINEPTGSGFFYTRGGWAIYRDVFGANTEISPGEFDMPVQFNNVEEAPPAPASGVTLFAESDSLKVIKPDGTVVVIA